MAQALELTKAPVGKVHLEKENNRLTRARSSRHPTSASLQAFIWLLMTLNMRIVLLSMS